MRCSQGRLAALPVLVMYGVYRLVTGPGVPPIVNDAQSNVQNIVEEPSPTVETDLIPPITYPSDGNMCGHPEALARQLSKLITVRFRKLLL